METNENKIPEGFGPGDTTPKPTNKLAPSVFYMSPTDKMSPTVNRAAMSKKSALPPCVVGPFNSR